MSRSLIRWTPAYAGVKSHDIVPCERTPSVVIPVQAGIHLGRTNELAAAYAG
jgi:hypothetical protein